MPNGLTTIDRRRLHPWALTLGFHGRDTSYKFIHSFIRYTLFSDWPHAPPLTAVGLRLSNEAVRMAIDFRIGTNVCQPIPVSVTQLSTEEHTTSYLLVSARFHLFIAVVLGADLHILFTNSFYELKNRTNYNKYK